ncbi:hypothetical protein ACFQL4_26565 [Halosimplex aquaticum]
MSDTWDARTEEYSGDVRLAGSHEAPVGLRGAEDVFVGPDAVAGTLRLADVEYVFTDVPDGDSDSTAAGDGVATEVTGDLEDGYVEDVDGDVVVSGVEDVFVAYDAAETLDAAGAEQVFHDDAAAPTGSPDGYDVTVTGWNHSRDARDPGTACRSAARKTRSPSPTRNTT